jgi:disulfide bond formation protein DsbB
VDSDTFSLFAALLALLALLGAVALVVLRLVSGRSALAAELLAAVRPVRFHLGALVAATAMGGSLWFSEVEGFPPCEFCWYQRIAMYPLVAVLGVAAWRRDEDAVPTATILAGIGAALAVYHYQLQRFPDQGSSCDATAPCTAIWVEELGFITIPAMAFAGFVAILALIWAPRATVGGPGGAA